MQIQEMIFLILIPSLSFIHKQSQLFPYQVLPQLNLVVLLADLEANWIPIFKDKYPNLDYSFEGEVKNAGTTQKSMMNTFIVGLFGDIF